MKKYMLFFTILTSFNAFSAAEVPTCTTDSTGNIVGNYNAIQQQAYNSSCEIQFAAVPNNKVVPVGNNGGGTTSRIKIAPYPAPEGLTTNITMKLNGPEDNTLSNGKRGREEVASCYITDSEFNALSADEQAFRRVSNDFYRGCAQATGRAATFSFYLRFDDTSANPYQTWDSIVMQLHAQNDKDRYCIPGEGIPQNICNANNGTVNTVTRSAEAYNAVLAQNGVFEKDIQPPLSFRIKDGYLAIVATSGLTDANNNPTEFTPSKTCSIDVINAVVGKPKYCPDTGKTSTVVYRSQLDPKFPSNTYIHFNVSVIWPKQESNDQRLKVEYTHPTDGTNETLVDTNTTPFTFGTYDNAYPYFKAGVYRQNSNGIPTTVRLLHFRILPYAG